MERTLQLLGVLELRGALQRSPARLHLGGARLQLAQLLLGGLQLLPGEADGLRQVDRLAHLPRILGPGRLQQRLLRLEDLVAGAGAAQRGLVAGAGTGAAQSGAGRRRPALRGARRGSGRGGRLAQGGAVLAQD